jgi:hypothetical protein
MDQLLFVLNERYKRDGETVFTQHRGYSDVEHPPIQLEGTKYSNASPSVQMLPHSPQHKNTNRRVSTKTAISKQKNSKNSKYVSPFIRDAEERAQLRSKAALSIQRKQRSRQDDWNIDSSVPSLFDTTLKKQEIFRIEPRKPERAPDKSVPAPSVAEKEKGAVRSVVMQRPLTMKTTGVCIYSQGC